VHVVIHTISLNPEVDADIAAMIAVSAALAVSGMPFNGPIGAARVGYINGEYVLNPGQTQRKDSQMDLVVAGTESAVLMVESEAQQLPEEVMLGAVVFGHEQGKIAIDAIHDLVREGGKPAWDWTAPAKDEALIAKVVELGEAKLRAAYQSATSRCVPWLAALPTPTSRPPDRARRGVRRRQGRRHAVRHRSRHRAFADPGGRAPSTAATPAPCAPSRSATPCCPAPTARRCSRVVKPRPW
jgi:hypothetical protein